MALVKVNGIVVRYANYRESDRILTLLTAERGLITVTARGCRRPKSPLLEAGELFTSGEFMLFYNRDRFTLDACEIQDRFYPLREDYGKLAAASYMIAQANECAPTGERSDALIRLLLYALTYTAYDEGCDPLDIALCFTLKLIKLIGYSPAITNCAVCGCDLREEEEIAFSPVAGGAVCGRCGRGEGISRTSLEAMRRMLLLPDEDMRRVKLPPRVRGELKPALNGYLEHIFNKHFKAFELI